MKVLETDPKPPRSLNPAIPADLSTICLKCLDKQPAQRYQSAASLSEDLNSFLNQQPIRARAPNPVRRLWGIAKRRPWLLTGIAAACVPVLLAAIYWLWSENAFLRYKAENPEHVREAGVASQRLVAIRTLYFLALLGWTAFFISFGSGQRDVGWFRRRRRKGKPVPPNVIGVYGVLGAAITILGLVFTRLAIDAHIWEGTSIWGNVVEISLILYLGITVVIHALREYEIMAFASKMVELSKDQEHEVRGLILDTKEKAAEALCREFTGSKRDAHELFCNLRDALVEEFPDRFPRLAMTPNERVARGCLSLCLMLGIAILIAIFADALLSLLK
jgi:hypothetical protein